MWLQAIKRFVAKIFKIKMRNNIKLFIGDKEVDFKSTPDILLNFTQEDLTNPTIVNNSYSKTLTIEGTPNNNKIFGHFWNLDRIQRYGNSGVGVDFNPSRKTPFSLYVNGTLYESGYVKLEEVRRKGANVEFDVSLYGGLGEFFYILSYDDEGNKLKLSDLTYMPSGDDAEFDFTIDKDTINEAWYTVGPYGASNKWHYINFAPCYNGIPSDFSADKALINFSGSPLPNQAEVGSVTYRDYNGYALATLPDKVDEWGMRDLRSYLQRPVMSIDALFRGCGNWAEQNGYSIDLDSTFFNPDNPYYSNAWFTLPMLNEIDVSSTSDEPTSFSTFAANYVLKYNGWQNSTFRIALNPDMPVGTNKMDMDFRYVTYAELAERAALISGDTLYTSALISSEPAGKQRHFGAICVQVLCYDGTNISSSRVVGGSDILVLTSKVDDDYIKWYEIADFYTPKWNADFNYSFGEFEPVGNAEYRWTGDLSFNLEIPSKTRCLAIDVITTASPIDGSYGGRRGLAYNDTHLERVIFTPEGNVVNTLRLLNDYTHTQPFSATTVSAYTASQTAGYSGAQLSKKLLLATESTPADYLLSYCKQFGLMFMKRPEDKVIHIMQRGTFYNNDNSPVDLDKIIDHNQDIAITPLTFDSKWYDMSLEMVEGDFSARYQNTYGRQYGCEKINTGFEFNAEEVPLIQDNTFKSAVEGTARNRYYLAPVEYSGQTGVPYVTFQGFKYNLYSGSSSYTVDLTTLMAAVNSIPMGGDKYDDSFPKVQFCDADLKGKDGSGVLLFYRGYAEPKDSNGDAIPYFITDDLTQMGQLNDGEPCWLYTSMETDAAGHTIAYKKTTVPSYSRYVNYDGDIVRSWDFGEPKQLFIPESVTHPESAIYNYFWKDYINDLYDINTRKLNCFVVRDKFENAPELFRKLYRFENCYWRLNSILDWNLASYDTGSAEFVKVNNAEAYTSHTINDSVITMTIDLEQDTIGGSGGTIAGHITISDYGPWQYTGDEDVATVSPNPGRGNMDITVTVSANPNPTPRTVYLYFEFGDTATRVAITQAAGQ